MKRPVVAVLALAAIAAAGALTLPGTGVLAAGTATGPQQLVTVTALTPPQSPGGPAPAACPANMPSNTWCATQTDTGTVTIATAPDGRSALRFSTPGNTDKANASTSPSKPLTLSQVTSASYDTYSDTATAGIPVPTLQLEITTGIATQPTTTLVFEPAYVGGAAPVQPRQWQRWDATTQPGWWSTKDATPVYTTLAATKIRYPNAVVNRIGVNQGSGNPGVVAFADAARINGTTYDFESTPLGTTTVTSLDPDAANGTCPTWCATPTAGGSAMLVVDPLAPSGGALQLSTPADADAVWVHHDLGGALGGLNALAYQTSRGRNGGAALLPALTLDVTTPATPTVTLLWEPVYAESGASGIKSDNSWQQWVPSSGPGWWSFDNRSTSNPAVMANTGEVGTLGFPQYTATLADVKRALSTATLQAIGLNQGTGNPALDAKADLVQVNGTQYDFQPGIALPSLSASPSPSPSPSATGGTTGGTTGGSTGGSTGSGSTGSDPGTGGTTGTSTGGSTGSSGSTGSTGTSGTAGSTPTPTTSPTSSPASTSPSLTKLVAIATPTDITPGIASLVAVHGSPNKSVQLLAYSRPSTSYAVVRDGITDANGDITFHVTPGTNTRLYAHYTDGAAALDSLSTVIQVHTALSLSAYRDGVRQYHFQGRNLPRRAGQLITLYRVDANGNELRTAITRTDTSGTWRIDRQFTGSGQFTFVARTSQTLTNAAGRSNVRQTIIH